MSLKEKLKKISGIVFWYEKLNHYYYCLLTCISPTLNSKVLYKRVFKRSLNLKHPETFEEKLLWLKLKRYNHDPLVIQCADKYKAREYVKEVCGEDLLNEIYAVYESPKDIVWDSLPDCFALKWTFGAGYNIICPNKSELSSEQNLRKLAAWKRKKPWLIASELQYKYIPQKIICEKYLGRARDYKVYCFHGEPKAIMVIQGRDSRVESEFFDIKWNLLKNTDKYPSPDTTTPRPDCLEELLEAARKLSKPFPFVRCDFFIVDNKVYFGEMTFTPAACVYVAQTEIDGKNMTEFLRVP